jgi:dihydrofolate synthase / folylpolyglutamate synthase
VVGALSATRRAAQAAVAGSVPDTSAGVASVGTGTYGEALDYLFARTTGKWRLGLERMGALLRAIGQPQDALRAFHVGGTNGKGSVCATLEAVLRARGFRVGFYSSPHLIDFRERFLIDGVPISEDDVVSWIARRTPLVERLHATFFEATTAMAFELFAHAGIDVAVVEVGLGGRLDATNMLTPIVAGVSSIGIDHVEFLGHSREQIAWEKAGIFKPGRPAVIGEPDPTIRTLLATFARNAGADPVRIVSDECTIGDVDVRGDLGDDAAAADAAWGTWFTLGMTGQHARLHTPLAGTHQATNTALALTMLDAAGSPYATSLADAGPALAHVHLPGRFHRQGRYIFDVAHNPDGAAVLAQTLRAVHPPAPVAAVLTVLADKDWRGIMTELAGVVSHFVVTTAPSAPASRAWDPEVARAFAESKGWSVRLEPDFGAALAHAAAEGATILVTGSFHTVGDAMARLQPPPLRT